MRQRLHSKKLGIIVLALLITLGSVGIALAGRPRQTPVGDLYVIDGDYHCTDVLAYTDNLASVIPGEEGNIFGAYDFGERIMINSVASAPGDSVATASVEYLVCMHNRLNNFYVEFNLSSQASGGYYLSYEYDVRRDNGSSALYHEEDTAGGGAAACLEIGDALDGQAAAVWQGSYYYGMQFYADASVNSNFCVDDGVAVAAMELIVAESESPTPTPSPLPTDIFFSPLATPTGPTPTPVVCGAGYRLVGAECVHDSFEPEPTAAARVAPLSIQAIPTCNGAELLSGPLWLLPGESWSKLQRVPYAFFNTRFTVWVATGDSYQTVLYGGSYTNNATFGDGILGGYYAAMIPAPPRSSPGGGDNLIKIEHGAGSSGNMQVASICIEDLPLVDECANPDPYLEDTLFWTLNGPVTFDPYGGAILDPGGYVYQYYYHMDPGNYELSIDAAAIYPETIMEVNYHYSNTLTSRIGLPGGPAGGVWAWNRYKWQFTVTAGDQDYPRPIGAGSIPENDDPERDKLIYIYRICIKVLPDDPTPTPTATPTPQPSPPPGCYNVDPGFDIPGMWMVSQAQVQDSELSLMSNAGYAQIGAAIPKGDYGVTIRQRSLPSCPAGYFKRSGIEFLGETSWFGTYFADSGSGSYTTYYADRKLYTAIKSIRVMAECYPLPGMQAQSIPIEATFMQIDYLCVSGPVAPGTATPTPTPTPTTPPGMTPTATPSCQQPSGCLNADPGMCGGGTWATVGGASLADGAALIPPGARIVAEIDQDTTRSYYAYLTMKCTAYAPAFLDWRSVNSPTACDTVGYADYAFLFPATGAAGALAKPLTDLLDDTWQPGVLISPLTGPAAPVSMGADGSHQFNALLAGDVFNFGVNSESYSWITVDSICIKETSWTPPTPDPGGGGDPIALEIWHPVCERDYSIQRGFSDNIFSKSYALLLGPGEQPGMPVHAVADGVVAAYGLNLSSLMGDSATTEIYTGCVVIDHSATFNAPVDSYYCNLDRLAIPSSLRVARGQLIGYTSAYQGDNGLRGDGLLAMGIAVDGEWDDPEPYFTAGFPDCRPYNIVAETYDTCAAEAGSSLIPPRFNPPNPSLWEVAEYIPWLAKKAYDVIGYPILCALVPLFNLIITTVTNAINAIVRAISPPLIFLYRIGRVFEYLLSVLQRVIAEIFALLDAMAAAAGCFRNIIVYFIGAIRAASSAQIDIIVPAEGSPFAFAIALAMTLIGSTVANILLTPIVSLFIAFASWKLIPWGIQHLRKAIGAQ